ncbi:uncharacterized protein LOC119688510 [Teleopsis dalmanni]|uniref:uncharacterized protein LOC119688510 n=1 Tax=Teleopsis dalmanni TaxID=139649 RepID=UPI0018CD52DB|nr:uncharacterized protein LOC119688510 [Teleopsis dalmanni]
MDKLNNSNELDVTLTASSSNNSSPELSVAECVPAIGLEASTHFDSATVCVKMDPDGPPSTSPLAETVYAPAVTSSRSQVRRQEIIEVLSSNSETVESDDSDTGSVVSQKSGLTVVGSKVGNLTLESPKFTHLKRSERRRFKAAMSSGHSRAEALKIAMQHPPANKRVRSEEQSPGLFPAKKHKVAHVGLTKPSYSLAVKGVRLGFTSADPAGTSLSTEQITLLQEAIIDVAIEQHNDEIQPEFEGCLPRTGWLLIVCSDAKTAEWVKKFSGHIGAKSGLALNVVEEKDFPRTHVVRGYFPQSLTLSNEKVLATIGTQNKFSTTRWKVIRRLTQDQMLHLVFVIDDESMKKLSELKGRIAYRFGHLRLMLKGTTPAHSHLIDNTPKVVQDDNIIQSSSAPAASITDDCPTVTVPEEEELDTRPSTSKAVCSASGRAVQIPTSVTKSTMPSTGTATVAGKPRTATNKTPLIGKILPKQSKGDRNKGSRRDKRESLVRKSLNET